MQQKGDGSKEDSAGYRWSLARSHGRGRRETKGTGPQQKGDRSEWREDKEGFGRFVAPKGLQKLSPGFQPGPNPGS